MRTLLPLLCLLSLTAQTAKHVITHQDVWMMKRTGDAALSPDGRWVVFSLTEPDYDAAKQSSDLWLVPADGSAAPRKLTATRAGESGAVWSPDSRRIAFSARRDGDEAPQIYILSLDGGEAVRATTYAGGAASPRFRPDGKAILFESMVYPANDDRKTRKWSARIYETFPIRYWNVWLDEARAHVFVQDLADGAKPKDLLEGTRLAASRGFAGLFSPTGGDQQLQSIWTPDGQSVIFTAFTNRDETMSAETESHLFSAPAAGGEPKQLTTAGQSFSGPRFSPDGKVLYARHSKAPTPTRI